MKKLFYIGVMMCLGMTSGAFAQDCEYILLPKFGNDYLKLVTYPTSKLDYFCRLSSNSLFVTDEVPQGATVYDITVLKDVQTGQNLPSNFRVNLDSLSLYAYDFARYRVVNESESVYFRTPGSEHQYLGLRSYAVSLDMTYPPDSSMDNYEDPADAAVKFFNRKRAEMQAGNREENN